MIGRQQPIRRFWPVTGRLRLVEHVLLTALLEPSERVVIVGGEERGTWMLEHQMSSDRAFAFALELTAESAGAVGRVNFALAAVADEDCPGMGVLADAVAERRALHWQGAGGAWMLEWLV
jgi:hypothetical protein